MESQRPNQPMPEPDPGLCGCDRDVFLRVWRRVMPEDTPACPIAVDAPMQTLPAPVPHEMPAPTVVDRAGNDFPAQDDVPCLGRDGRADRERLQEFILQESAHRHTYQMLARRGGQGSRTLSAMAESCRKHAKRLSTALFLISGVCFRPTESPTHPVPRSYLGALRELFLSEQNRSGAYRAAAEESRDHCLQMLYLDLADECMEHAVRIRMLLENS